MEFTLGSTHAQNFIKCYACIQIVYYMSVIFVNYLFSHLLQLLKGTATLMITMFNMQDLNKPLILIPVSSKSVEKCGSCGHLNICKWTAMEAAIL